MARKIGCLVILLACILDFRQAHAEQDKMRIAIMDLQAIGVSTNTSLSVSDILRTELFNTSLFIVLERAEMEKVLSEQGFQQSGCTESECAVRIGRLLSARKVLVGTVNKLGENFIINARIVDIESGTMEFGDNTMVESESQLYMGCKIFAAKIAGQILVKNGTPSAETNTRQSRIQKAGVVKKQETADKDGKKGGVPVATPAVIFDYRSAIDQDWFQSYDNPDDYIMSLDKKTYRNSPPSVYIAGRSAKVTGYGSHMMMVKAEQVQGKSLKMTAWVRIKDIKGNARMFLWAKDSSGAFIGENYRMTASLKGDTDWTKCEIEMDVSRRAVQLGFGINLDCAGSAWMSDLQFEVTE